MMIIMMPAKQEIAASLPLSGSDFLLFLKIARLWLGAKFLVQC